MHGTVAMLMNCLFTLRLVFYKHSPCPQDLVKRLMQMVSVSPVPIQHDIITSLPEILEDSQQSEVAAELRYQLFWFGGFFVCFELF